MFAPLLILILIIAFISWIASVQSSLNELKRNVHELKSQLKTLTAASPTAKPIGPVKASAPAEAHAKAESPAATHPASVKPVLEKKAVAAKPVPSLLVKPLEEKSPESPESPKLPKPASGEREQVISSFEKLVMGNLFNKIGAVALIVGLAIFIRLISPYIDFTPLKRVMSVLVTGLAMMGVAMRLHYKGMKGYAEVLMGTGLAAIFVAVYGGASYYDVVPDRLAMVLGVVMIMVSAGIAQYCKSFSTMVIALLGGYLSPFILEVHSSTTFLFSYLLFLNAISLVYVYFNRPKFALNYVNLVLTFLFVTLYDVTTSLTGHEGYEQVSFALPMLLWLIYAMSDFANMRLAYDVRDKVLTVLNFAVLVFFAHWEHGMSTGWILVATALVYAGMGIGYRRFGAEVSKLYLSGAVLALLFATYFIEQETLRIGAWALEGLLLALAVRLSGERYWAKWAVVPFVAASSAALLNMNSHMLMRAVDFLTPTLCALGASLMLWRQCRRAAPLFLLISLTLFFLYALIEINMQEGYDRYVELYSKLVLAFIYALSAWSLYRVTQFVLFRVASYIVYILAAVVLVSMSFAYLEALPFLNMRLAGMAAAIACSVLMARGHREMRLANLLVLLALSYFFIYLHIEINYLLIWESLKGDSPIQYYINVMLLLAYTLSAFKLGSLRCSRLLRYVGYGCLWIVSGVILSQSFAHHDMMAWVNVRALATLLTVAVLVGFGRRHVFALTLAQLLGLSLITSEMMVMTQGHQVLLTVAWALYAAALMGVGIASSLGALKMFGICLIGIAGLKFVFIDLADAEALYQTIAFLSIGVLLMAVSYYYSKSEKREEENGD